MKNKYYTISKTERGYYVKINSVPVLYKYQSINDYSTRALLNGEIWGTIPKHFNDPYDSLLCYNRGQILREITNRLTDCQRKSYAAYLGKRGIEEIQNKIIDDFINLIRMNYVVSCYSEIIDSEIMWAHYANRAKGFAIAYDGEILKKAAETSKAKNFNALLSLLPELFQKIEDNDYSVIGPVMYLPGKMNCSEDLISCADQVLSILDGLYQGKTMQLILASLRKDNYEEYVNSQRRFETIFCSAIFNKNKCWKYEKEWRLWGYNVNFLFGKVDDPHALIATDVKPKAIYLGEEISNYDEIALIEIAKNKLFVPVYKMKTKIRKNSFKLIAEKL